ncbi:hypothetical protein [Mesotoga sp.]|uniref:hypothetical protein n=1 Tax=Mesotoga sp. TaxID=2053577 RepID=UPI00345EC1A7
MRLRAPATTANMGSGFDVVGMALKLHNTVQFEKANRLKVLSIGRYGREIEDAEEVFRSSIARFEKITGKVVPGIQIIQEVRDTSCPGTPDRVQRQLPPHCL